MRDEKLCPHYLVFQATKKKFNRMDFESSTEMRQMEERFLSAYQTENNNNDDNPKEREKKLLQMYRTIK